MKLKPALLLLTASTMTPVFAFAKPTTPRPPRLVAQHDHAPRPHGNAPVPHK